MKVWYVSAYDQPKGQSTRTYDYSRELVARGHDVTMFCNGYCHFTGREHLNPGEAWRVEFVDGIRVVWLRTYHYRGNGVGRGLNMLTNVWRLIRATRALGLRPDVVLGPSVPLLTGFFCSLAISASYFEAVHVLGLDNGTFWSALQNSVDFWDDFGVALLKSAVFGGTSALVAAYVGFHAEPTIEGTSVATTRAVVNASLLVLMFNFVMSALLFRS